MLIYKFKNDAEPCSDNATSKQPPSSIRCDVTKRCLMPGALLVKKLTRLTSHHPVVPKYPSTQVPMYRACTLLPGITVKQWGVIGCRDYAC